MSWRGGVTIPNIREKQKRPSEDGRKKFQKIKKEGSNTAYSVPYAVQTVVAQWFAGFAYGAYRNFLNLFYETYFLWKYIEIYCRYCRWSIKKIDISMV